jgi:carboxymethylenebutenolidase
VPPIFRIEDRGSRIEVQNIRSSILVFCLLCGLIGCGRETGGPSQPGAKAETRTVSYRSGKDTLRGVLHRPAGKGPFPAIILVHGDFGLTDWVKAQGRRLADKGFVTLAVDLYRGRPAADVMDAHIMGRGLPEEQVDADLKAAAAYLRGRADVRGEALGIIGWGQGGGYALDAALNNRRLRAVVVCYGRLTTDARLLAPLKAAVLGIFAGKDEGISRATVRQFRAALRRAKKRVAGIHVYPNCGHGFMDPSEPGASGAASARAAADAWDKIERFFAAELSSG